MTEPNNPHRPDEAGVSGWPSEAGRDPYGQPSNPYQMPAPYSSGLPVAENHRRPYVDFGLAIKLFFKNYAVFRGRASRSEYWWTVLFNFIIAVAIQALMPILQGVGLMSAITSNSTTEFSAMSTSGVIFTMLPLAWLLAIIIPCLALTVRRLHDVNHSGWWVMAPTLCGIVSAIMMILAFVSAAANDGKPSMALLTIGIVLFVAIFVVNIILLIFVISDSHPEAWKKYDTEPLPVTERARVHVGEGPRQVLGPAPTSSLNPPPANWPTHRQGHQA